MSASSEPQQGGPLNIYGPHWSAQLKLYDSALRPIVDQVGEISKPTLPVGLYQVEASIGDQVEQRVVIVRPGKPVIIEPEQWQLRFPSAAPIERTSTTREQHREAAERYSRELTHGSATPASRLFIFIRTLQPQQDDDLAQDLQLLDRHGKLITDFRKEVATDPSEGWLACTLDLPDGFYMLRRGRRGVRVRFQPIWLCQGYETHVFVPVQVQAQLRNLSLSMAPYGTGFSASDSETYAAEAVLLGLQRGRNMATAPQLRELLEGKFRNPWLGILAAHALLLDPEPHKLLPVILGNLSARIPGHPDLRALQLEDEHPTNQLFATPPLLWRSLQRILRHENRHQTTILQESMAERIFNQLLSDSPWVAWRNPQRRHTQPSGVLGGGGDKTYFEIDLTENDTLLDLELAVATESEDYSSLSALQSMGAKLSHQDGAIPSEVAYAYSKHTLWADLDIHQLGQQLNLPWAIVETNVRTLRAQPWLLASPRTLQPELYVIAQALLRRAWQRQIGRIDVTVRNAVIEQARRLLVELKQISGRIDKLLRSGSLNILMLTAALRELIERAEQHMIEWEDAVFIATPSGQLIATNSAALRLRTRAAQFERTNQQFRNSLFGNILGQSEISFELTDGMLEEYHVVQVAVLDETRTVAYVSNLRRGALQISEQQIENVCTLLQSTVVYLLLLERDKFSISQTNVLYLEKLLHQLDQLLEIIGAANPVAAPTIAQVRVRLRTLSASGLHEWLLDHVPELALQIASRMTLDDIINLVVEHYLRRPNELIRLAPLLPEGKE